MPGNSASRWCAMRSSSGDEGAGVADRPRSGAGSRSAPSRGRRPSGRWRDRARARRGSARGWRCRGTGVRARPPAASAPGRRPSRSARPGTRGPSSAEIVVADHADVVLGERRRSSSLEVSLWRPALVEHPLADGRDRLRRRAPVGAGVSKPASIWSCRPATRTM